MVTRGGRLWALILAPLLALASQGCAGAETPREDPEPATSVAPEVPAKMERFEFRSGQITRFPRPVVLQRLRNRDWVTLASGRTGADGRFRFTLSIEAITTLRALSPSTTYRGRSYPEVATTPVTVRPVDQIVNLATASTSDPLRLTVVTHPVRPGRTVTLQRRLGRDWVASGTGTVDSSGRLLLRLRRPAAPTDYRVRMAGWNGAPPLTSAAISVAGSDPDATGCTSTVLTIIAHQDDDIIFMNPDLQNDLDAGACATTVFLTAGDSGNGEQYWKDREVGPELAYATMIGLDAGQEWTRSERTFAGHEVRVSTSPGAGRVTLYSLRLPDGALDGDGTRTTGNQSMIKLLDHRIASIAPLDGTARYDRTGLIATVRAIAASTRARTVRIQDGRPQQNDHADHMAGARIAAEALAGTGTRVVAYRGYGIRSEPPNVSGEPLARKTRALLSYQAYDPELCRSADRCPEGDTALWVRRQYRVPPIAPR